MVRRGKADVVRLIIAGTRDADHEQARAALRRGFDELELYPELIAAIATGESGVVDRLGKVYATHHQIWHEPFPANWDAIGKAAGPLRNAAMATWAADDNGVLVAVWDGKSRGTADMILAAHRCGLEVHVELLRGAP